MVSDTGHCRGGHRSESECGNGVLECIDDDGECDGACIRRIGLHECAIGCRSDHLPGRDSKFCGTWNDLSGPGSKFRGFLGQCLALGFRGRQQCQCTICQPQLHRTRQFYRDASSYGRQWMHCVCKCTRQRAAFAGASSRWRANQCMSRGNQCIFLPPNGVRRCRLSMDDCTFHFRQHHPHFGFQRHHCPVVRCSGFGRNPPARPLFAMP